MKIALVHDYLKEYGGAEKVLEAFHELWPEAPVYTTVYLPQFLGPHRERFAGWNIITSGFQKIPFIDKMISPVRLFSPWVFENWDFRSFDVILVSATGAYFPNLILRNTKTLHVCYCHTPPRYLYGYQTARNWQKTAFGKIIANVVNHKLRLVDFVSAQRPDYFIANSHEVRHRIEKFYRREADVIYPPVDLPVSRGKKKVKRTYYLAGGRLARAKRIDLAIEVCNRLKLPLKIFGKSFAGYGDELKNLAGPTVEFMGEVTEDEKSRLYQGAIAFICPSRQEDFGIMPVEAMAYGVPVIALNEGGLKETVIDGKTGVLFGLETPQSLIEAVKRLEKMDIQEADCRLQASKFSRENFKKNIREFIETKYSSYAGTSRS